MNNTEKKLDALIDALGFDVEKKHVFDADAYQRQCCVYALTCLKANKEDHIQPEFKFTKRDEPVNHEWTVDTNTSYALDDEHTENANRPPLGLTPKSIHDGVREEEIISAMIRYLKDRKAIPDLWFSELYTLQADRS
jgi:hypothetical protein